MAPRKTFVAGTVVAVLGLLGLTACQGQADGGDGNTNGERWTAEEVLEATGDHQVRSIFEVPKSLDREYVLGFANPSLSYPPFAALSQGMHDAAEFYGVRLVESDLAFDYASLLDNYDQLAVQGLDIFGSGTMNEAVVAQLQADGVPGLTVDAPFEGVDWIGIKDSEVGQLAASVLDPAVQEKMQGDWAGRDVQVLGVTEGNCAPCDARSTAAFEVFANELGLPEENMHLQVGNAGGDIVSGHQSAVTDFLTAHPDSVVIVVSYGDDPVIGAINAAKAAGRTADMLAVAGNGGESAQAALRDPANAGILLASVDTQSYSEGWAWVEAAIATILGEDHADFVVDRILTADNVDQFYPKS